MTTLSALFKIYHGNKFDMNKMSSGDISFIGRSAQKNGVTGKVAEVPQVSPYPAGLITVALGGSVLSSFVQPTKFYTGQNVAILEPIKELTTEQKLYYCAEIKANAYRFTACGREANRFLKDLPVSDLSDLPIWLKNVSTELTDSVSNSLLNKVPSALHTHNWKYFNLIDFFSMKAGKYIPKKLYGVGSTPYVSASDNNNGIMLTIGQKPTFKGNSITIGKVGVTTYYQESNFCASSDVTILHPSFQFNKYIGLFLATLIGKESFKWSYGKQIRLEDSKGLVIKLPVTNDGKPDWLFMENYIKSLPYSSQL